MNGEVFKDSLLLEPLPDLAGGLFRALVAVLPSEEFCVDLLPTAFVGDSENVCKILMLWIVRAAELLEVCVPP